MGQRVMFSNNLDVARRVCDRRHGGTGQHRPHLRRGAVNEGHWALGSLPLTDDGEELDTALEVVRRFADLLQVLPPLQGHRTRPTRAIRMARPGPNWPTRRQRCYATVSGGPGQRHPGPSRSDPPSPHPLKAGTEPVGTRRVVTMRAGEATGIPGARPPAQAYQLPGSRHIVARHPSGRDWRPTSSAIAVP